MMDVITDSRTGAYWVVTANGYLARFRPGVETSLKFVRFLTSDEQQATLKEVQRYCKLRRLEPPTKTQGLTADAIKIGQQWIRQNS